MRMRIVLVDDEEIVHNAVASIFNRYDTEHQFHLEAYVSLEDAINAQLPPAGVSPIVHVLLLDPGLEKTSGEETIKRALDLFGDKTPIVCVTGGNGETEMLRAGAHAYVLKTHISGRSGWRRLIGAMNDAIALAHGGRPWVEVSKTVNRTSDRLRVIEDRMRWPIKLGKIALLVGPLVAFLIDHNWIAIAPNVASNTTLEAHEKSDKDTFATKADLAAEQKQSHRAAKKLAAAIDDVMDVLDQDNQQISWVGEAMEKFLVAGEGKKWLLRQRPKPEPKKHKPIKIDDGGDDE